MGKITKAKWIVGIVAILIIGITLTAKALQLIFIRRNGGDMTSFSPWSIALVAFVSVLFLSLAFLDRGFNKRSLKKPDNLVFIGAGITGLIYAFILAVWKLKDMGLI